MVEFGRKTLLFLLSLLTIIIIGIVISYVVFIPKIIKSHNLEKEIIKYEKEEAIYSAMLENYENMKALNKYVRGLIGISESEQINIDSLLTNKNSSGVNETNEANNIENVSISLENIPTKAPVSGIITQEFDKSTDINKNTHSGIDISGAIGTPISAAASGLVVFSGWTNNLGNLIIIVHDNKYVTVYGHNSKNIVKERQIVKKGQLIALLGNSGHSTGPHLHFEIWKDTETKDPREFIAEYGKNN